MRVLSNPYLLYPSPTDDNSLFLGWDKLDTKHIRYPYMEPDWFIQGQVGGCRDEKFSWLRAGKNFVSGLFAPVAKIIRHPVRAALGLVAGVALGVVFPVTIPLMFIGGAMFAGYKLVKGAYNAVSNYCQGNVRAAENAFYDMGEGTSTMGLTLLGTRKAAIASAEARASVTGANAELAAQEAASLGLAGKLKSIFAMFSRDGVYAVWKNLVDPVKNWSYTNRAQISPLIKAVLGLIPGVNSIPGLVSTVDPALNLLGSIPNCPKMCVSYPAQALGHRDNNNHRCSQPVWVPVQAGNLPGGNVMPNTGFQPGFRYNSLF